MKFEIMCLSIPYFVLCFNGRVQWLVLDEGDKLFEEGTTGFREQVRLSF